VPGFLFLLLLQKFYASPYVGLDDVCVGVVVDGMVMAGKNPINRKSH